MAWALSVNHFPAFHFNLCFQHRIFIAIRASWLFIFLFVSDFSQAQSDNNTFLKPSDTLNKPRRTGVYVGESVALGVTLVGLNQLWYKDYPKSSFGI